MGGKKSFITNANKKATENFGNSKIEGIVKALSNCGFYCVIEPKLHNEKFSTRNKIRNPDIIIKFGGMEVILESTMQRNNDFEKTNYNYIVINHEHIKELKKILGIVANDEDLVNFISAYRACEEYSKHISKKPVEE